MTWRKWWALEVLAGIVLIVAAYPLSTFNYVVVVFTATLLPVFYLHRVQAQKERENQR